MFHPWMVSCPRGAGILWTSQGHRLASSCPIWHPGIHGYFGCQLLGGHCAMEAARQVLIPPLTMGGHLLAIVIQNIQYILPPSLYEMHSNDVMPTPYLILECGLLLNH